MIKCKKIILVFLIILVSPGLFAAEILEIKGTVDDTNIKILKILSNITEDSFYSPQKTRGFVHRYSDKWYSPFNFDIYVGKINKNSLDSLIRIESPLKGEAKVLRQIIEWEILKNPDMSGKQISSKSHILSQLFNIVTPAASVYYNSYGSPLYYGNDASKKMFIYILTDILLVGGSIYYAEKTNWKKNIYDDMLLKNGPSKGVFQMKNSGFVVGALLTTRLIRVFGAASETGTQNRLTELSYTYKF